MKKIILLPLAILLISFLTGTEYSENKINVVNQNNTINNNIKKVSEVIRDKRQTENFSSVKLFDFSENTGVNDNTSSFVNKATLLKLNTGQLRNFIASQNENIEFKIPVNERDFAVLELTRSLPVSEDFTIFEKSGNGDRYVNYKHGLHYNGIIKGNEKSLASLSVFDNMVVAIISDENGNYVLGSITNNDNSNSENYIYYNDADLNIINSYKCGVEDYEEKFIRPYIPNEVSDGNNQTDDPNRLPIKVYFEADFKMYQDNGNNTQNVGNFITAMFNNVKTIYQNEQIPFVVSSVGVWTANDPYSGLNDSYIVLLRFGGNTRDNFQGNIAHLLSTRTANLGGIAWIRVMCSNYSAQDSAGRFAFSNMENNYQGYPTFSWTVQVITHEMGHSIGSRHTHSCVWPVGGGVNRAIDSCYNAEGNCFTQLRPRVGTIMSYCHLWPVNQGGGINLASGFGPLPGDTIRLRYAQASCLTQELNSSEQPSTFDLYQNSPNPFNPETKIRFALPQEANVSLKIYDISGKTIAVLLSDKYHAPGFYDVVFRSSEYNISSGIYFYELNTGNFREVKRMVLIK
ncbi:MAG: T9SS type A sorting domain-containing protein [Ignavibacteria bacterium]|nr:T9SS type A sorting domain-containing protein [Ignavibacteria bacterium]